MKKNREIGKKQQIQRASSVEEVNALLAALKEMSFVSAKTVAACHNAAKRRVKQLTK